MKQIPKQTNLPGWLLLCGVLLVAGCASDQRIKTAGSRTEPGELLMNQPGRFDSGSASNSVTPPLQPNNGTNGLSRLIQSLVSTSLAGQATNSGGHVALTNALAVFSKLLLALDTPALGGNKAGYPRPISETNQVGVWAWGVRPEVGAWGGLTGLFGGPTRQAQDGLTREQLGTEAAREVAQRLSGEMQKTFRCQMVALEAANAVNKVERRNRAGALGWAKKMNLDALVELEVHPRSGYSGVIKRQGARLQTRLIVTATIRRVDDGIALWRSEAVSASAESKPLRAAGEGTEARMVVQQAAANAVEGLMRSFRPPTPFWVGLFDKPIDPALLKPLFEGRTKP